MKYAPIIFVITLLISTLGACAPAQTTPEITVVISTNEVEENQDSYPVPQVNTGNVYPAPQQDNVGAYPDHQGEVTIDTSQTIQPDITQDPDMAKVIGVMLYNAKPVPGAILYLSEVIYSEDQSTKLVSFDRQSTTKAFTNQEGEFVFYNIPPGEYGLVLDTIMTSFILAYPDGSGEILVDLSPEDVIDLGILDYDELPIAEP